MTRVLRAEIYLVLGNDQPPLVDPPIALPESWSIREYEAYNTSIRIKLFAVEPAPQIPHQLACIEFVISEPVSHPSLSPCAVEFDYWLDFESRLRRLVLYSSCSASIASIDKAMSLEALQALRKQRRGHPGDTLSDLIEPARTTQNVPQDEERPSFAQNVRCARNGAILSISLHRTQ